MWFPSQATDYIEPRLNLDNILKPILGNMIHIDTSKGFLLFNRSLKAVIGDHVPFQFAD